MNNYFESFYTLDEEALGKKYEVCMGGRCQGKSIAKRENVYDVLMQILQDPNLESICINGVAIKFEYYSFDRERIYLFLRDKDGKNIASVPLTAIKTVY